MGTNGEFGFSDAGGEYIFSPAEKDAMEANFWVLPVGSGAVPLIETYNSDNPPPPFIMAAYAAQQAFFSGQRLPVEFMQDTMRFPAVRTTPANHAEPHNMNKAVPAEDAPAPVLRTAPAPRAPASGPRHAAPETDARPKLAAPSALRRHPAHALSFGERLRARLLRHRTAIIGSTAMVLAVSVGVGTNTMPLSADHAPKGSAATARDLAHVAAQRAVLQDTLKLRESATCAPEANVMADYLDRETASGVDLTEVHPPAAEYRAASVRAERLDIPCTGPGRPSATADGEVVSGDALLGYMFDVTNLCSIGTRVEAQNSLLNGVDSQLHERNTADLQALFAQADKDCA